MSHRLKPISQSFGIMRASTASQPLRAFTNYWTLVQTGSAARCPSTQIFYCLGILAGGENASYYRFLRNSPLFMQQDTFFSRGLIIDPALHPYSWYKRLVVEGARQHRLPPDYIANIEAMRDTEDADKNRDAANRRISC